MKENELVSKTGTETARGLRQTSKYNETQDQIDRVGITEAVLNSTPPIGLNLQIIAATATTMDIFRDRFAGKDINVTVLGLAIPQGVIHVSKFVENFGATIGKFTVVDIDQDIISEVSNDHPNIIVLHKDARNSEILGESQDIVIRDHLGNCCPPAIDEAVNAETARILKKGGIGIVNITTSEELLRSEARDVISFDMLKELTEPNPQLIPSLNNEIYNIGQLTDINSTLFHLRSNIIEIANGSFVVFGEDQVGHGEWFRKLDDHHWLWEKDGFTLLEELTRKGMDSHKPPLACVRHNVILQKG